MDGTTQVGVAVIATVMILKVVFDGVGKWMGKKNGATSNETVPRWALPLDYRVKSMDEAMKKMVEVQTKNGEHLGKLIGVVERVDRKADECFGQKERV